MNKFEIAQILREIATLVELTDPRPKKSISYRRAAHSIETAENFEQLVAQDNLVSLVGIGKEISKMIMALRTTGRLAYYSYLKESVPSSLLELTHIPGLNNRKVKTLYQKLHISSIEQLQQAISNQQLSGIHGFGPSFINRLEKRILEYLKEGCRIYYSQASRIVHAIHLSLSDSVTHLQCAGAFRRKEELLHELNFLAISPSPQACITKFQQHSFVHHILKTTSSFTEVLLKHVIKVQLSVF